MSDLRASLLEAIGVTYQAIEKKPETFEQLRPHLLRLLDLHSQLGDRARTDSEKRARISERVVLHRARRLLQYGPNRADASADVELAPR